MDVSGRRVHRGFYARERGMDLFRILSCRLQRHAATVVVVVIVADDGDHPLARDIVIGVQRDHRRDRGTTSLLARGTGSNG